MNKRDCENCKNHTDKGCTKWECEFEPTTKNDLALIHTEGLDEEIRCTMCTNYMKSDRGCDGSCVVDKDMYKAVMDAIEKRIQPTSKNNLEVDCISRTAVLDLIETCNSDGLKGIFCSYNDGKRFEGYVKALPSVTPQEPRWISVSEKKPNKGGEYLLWGKIDENEEEDYCFIGDYHEFDEVFGTEISNYDPKTLGFIDTEIEEYYSVVAWMPLPTPYEPQESEE